MASAEQTYPVLPSTLLIISLKMYFTPTRTLDYLRALLDPKNDIVRPENRSKLLLALIPDFLTIYPSNEIIKNYESSLAPQDAKILPPPFLLGAQDCFWEPLGAYTGEVSPLALRSMGVSIVELGHAERRSIFGETDDQTGRKAAAASAHGMVPLVCIGEVTAPGPVASEAVGLAVRECEVQVRAVLEVIPAHAPVIFAYEPVWAIGQPKPAGVDHISAVVEGIKAVVGDRPGDVRILYGGSAGPGLWGPGGLGKAVDGMFLGRFAHEVEGVRKVVREVEETLNAA
ncbi:Triosephosphate isomerase [Aspergillus bertholletiae]|uniref:Triosephosphate isomerase n=1 Tax=Aspergillus bertholletiae TaxID=1226010 RepID=A0A5N7AU79_9EURO|nr:Triosephosphate isomerase [Aspergillus bertholletiae]